MKKSILKSKTLIGFGLAGIIVLAQLLGVNSSDALVVEVIKVLSTLFGAYGLRDAIK